MIAWVHSVPDDEAVIWLAIWIVSWIYVRWAINLPEESHGEQMPYGCLRLGGMTDFIVTAMAIWAPFGFFGCHAH
jgi:hypothetical protein